MLFAWRITRKSAHVINDNIYLLAAVPGNEVSKHQTVYRVFPPGSV